MAPYLVLDGHSLAYRAWYALSETGMTTASGQDTTAVYGFISMSTKLLRDWRPAGMAVAFDLRERTFRDEIAVDYKKGRTPAPDTFHAQVDLIREYLGHLRVPILEVPGFEADDVIATLATRLRDGGHDVIIVTGDRDAYQLVEDPHVKVLYNRRGVSDYVLYDEAGIAERTGVSPERYPFLAALRGDTSDNLPGVPGVGEKTAAKLVNTYVDPEELFARLSELTPKLRASVTECEQQIRVNLAVIPLVRDIELAVEVPDDLVLGGADRAALRQLFGLLEMRAVGDRLLETLTELDAGRPDVPSGEDSAIPGIDVQDLLGVAERITDPTTAVAALAGLAAGAGPVVVEPEWAGAPGRSALTGLAVLSPPSEDWALLVPTVEDPAGVDAADGEPGADGAGPSVEGEWGAVYLEEESLAVPEVLAGLGPLLAGGGRGYVAHRAKELMRFVEEQAGLDAAGLDLDTAVAAYLVDPTDGQTSLEEIARRRGVTAGSLAEPVENEQLSLDLTPASPDRGEACIERAAVVASLAPRLRAALERSAATTLYEDVERPLVRVLARMEVAGIGVDVDELRRISSELTTLAGELEVEVQELAGEPFKVNSTPQLRHVLYERLGLATGRKTKTGYSTDASSLEKLRGEHPIIDSLLRYREVEKLRSTYGEGLLGEVAADGRIHASFNQTVARTGRLSSDQPNLHNIPVRTDEGKRIRAVFVPPAGTELCVADYNQIELRVIAHLSGDPGLVEAFTGGVDIHNATASRVFGVEPAAVTTAQRSKAKMISYGLAYGMEAYGLSRRLGVPVEEAGEILDQYFIAFPAVRAYMHRTVHEARERGYTETLFGRRRMIPDLDSSNYRVRQAAERQAMNAGIQGLAADIFKVALVRLDAALEAGGYRSRIVLQVHDEVLVEVPEDERDVVGALTTSVMRGAAELSVPLEVNESWGHSWAEAKG